MPFGSDHQDKLIQIYRSTKRIDLLFQDEKVDPFPLDLNGKKSAIACLISNIILSSFVFILSSFVFSGKVQDLNPENSFRCDWKPNWKQIWMLRGQAFWKSENTGCPAILSGPGRSENKVQRTPSCKKADWKARPDQRSPAPVKHL